MSTPVLFEPPVTPSPSKPSRRRRFGAKFLIISVLAHVIFIAGAAYWVIYVVAPERPRDRLVNLPPTKLPPTEDERKADNRKRPKGGAAMPQRILTTESVKVTLTNIETPKTDTPKLSAVPGDFPGFGDPNGGKGPGYGGKPGLHLGDLTVIPGALVGEFYDLKYTRTKQSSGMDPGKYGNEVSAFVRTGWKPNFFSKYMKGTVPLYATQIFFKEIESTEAPKAFKSPVLESSGMWVAVYRGFVSPPASGTYRFVGAGDDDMIVRFDGKLVLDNCEHIDPQVPADGVYHYPGIRNKYARSQPVTVEAGKFYPIEILIGDHIPTKTMAALFVEQQGVTYQMDGGSPILPVFSVVARAEDESMTDSTLPPHMKDGPVWTGKAPSTSLLDDLK